jgi:GWxTD domain-containing protein
LLWKKPNEMLYFGCLVFWLVLGTDFLYSQQAETVPPAGTAGVSKETEVNAAPVFAVPAYLLRTFAFADSAGKVRLEVRFGLVNDILQFTKIGAACYRASYEANLAVFDAHAACVASRAWKRGLEVDHFSATNERTQLALDSTFFQLPPGDYRLHVEIVDLHTRRRLRRQYPLSLPDFHDGSLRLSALILGEGQQDSAGALALATCNLPALLHYGKPRQYLYYEIYGVKNEDRLTADYMIFSGTGDTLAFWSKTLIAAGNTVRCTESLDGRIQQRGAHNLRVQVRDASLLAAAEIEFKVHATAPDGDAAILDHSPELAYAPLQYISSEQDYRRILAAGSAGRDSVIAAFWQERDPTPDTVANELQSEFYRRVATAEVSFAAEGEHKKGWQTDRGRIYIIYGPPREVQVRASEQDDLTYQIWLYPEIDRRFIFRERGGSGRFELINR